MFNYNGGFQDSRRNNIIFTAGGSSPSPTADVSLEINGSNIHITWDPVSDVTGYQVLSSEDPYSGFTEDLTGTFTDESWSAPVTGIKKYFYLQVVSE